MTTQTDIDAIVQRDLAEPHRLLGAHPAEGAVVIRAFRPDADKVVARVEGGAEGLERIHFASGATLDRKALFFIQGPCQVPELLTNLGCDLTRRGTVETGSYENTNVPGLYVAGDASRRVQFAIVAAAEGAMAAFAINNELTDEDLL